LMAALLVGGDQVQIMMRLPAAVGMVLQGLILVPMLAGALLAEYRLRILRPSQLFKLILTLPWALSHLPLVYFT